MCSVSMLAREHGLPISLSITDFNDPKRSIFFMRVTIPLIKCDLEGREKANPLSNANPFFYPVLRGFGGVIPHLPRWHHTAVALITFTTPRCTKPHKPASV